MIVLLQRLKDLLHDDLEVAVLRERSEVLDNVPVPQGGVEHDLFVQRLDIAKIFFRNLFDGDADLGVQVPGRVDDAVRALAENHLAFAVIQVVLELKYWSV